jgi:hypothetical protein
MDCTRDSALYKKIHWIGLALPNFSLQLLYLDFENLERGSFRLRELDRLACQGRGNSQAEDYSDSAHGGHFELPAHRRINEELRKRTQTTGQALLWKQYSRDAGDGWDMYAACTSTRYQELLYAGHLRRKEPEADPKKRGDEQWRRT